MRVWYRNVDYGITFAWAALVATGLVAIYSTTHGPASEFLLASVRSNFDKQLIWAVICLALMGAALATPVRVIQYGSFPLYAVSVLLLIVALLFGHEVNGARCWLRLGPLQFQVSELAKVGTVLAVAQLLSARRANAGSIRYALLAVAVILVPALIILMQNDMGTALVFLGLIPILLFWSGLPLTTVLLMISPAIAGYLAIVYVPAAIAYVVIFSIGVLYQTKDRWMGALALLFTSGPVVIVSYALARVLQPYQVARILSFTNPEAEEYRDNVGFHLVQSKAAIGSGGIMGKGFMEGTQTQGAYVPEQSTDFIFSVIGEEFGFVGSIVVLLLFGLLLVRIITVGVQIKHPFAVMVAAGAAGIYLIHVFVNIGMATGILPVIGIPLPFVSYGGSALLSNTAMVAVLLTLAARRDDLSIYGY